MPLDGGLPPRQSAVGAPGVLVLVAGSVKWRHCGEVNYRQARSGPCPGSPHCAGRLPVTCARASVVMMAAAAMPRGGRW
jgi:hypothetical protein